MGRYLNVGNAGFEAVRKGIYVDKTGMISFINSVLGTTEKLICVSRPRRFGKSFAAQMLCAYYDKSCSSRELFEGLEISGDASFETYLNQYDVIYLDITEFISDAFVKKEMQNIVTNMESKIIEDLAAAYPEVKRERDLPNMLCNIAEATGHKFIFIIDEWDALFRENMEDKFAQDSYIRLLRGLFKNSGKTDKMIEAAYMTGILPIKKYGTQSAMTDFQEYTMLTPGPLAKYVGFTEAEVKALCEEYGMDFDEMKSWYDGYSFRRIESVYNPNSVCQAIKREEFGSYWVRTETYESLKIYIELDFEGLREDVFRMLAGERVRIDADMFQNDMSIIKGRDDAITLLVHLGYLAYDSSRREAYIPNAEVEKEFIRAVTASKHTEMVKLIRDSERLLAQTLDGDEGAVASAIEEMHKAICAPIHYNSEESLRSVIRHAYLACSEEFTREEELPSGHGYADIVFRPKRESRLPAILVELKWNKTAKSAIHQIKDRDYPHALQSYGGDILLVGINYDEKSKKHTCQIEKYRK